MSCNGCRVLRKGCKEDCILRQSLTAIEAAQPQANATLFLAKFFGRAALFSFLSAVPHYQRPGLFQSLLFEACGRTVNPVSGAVGLLCTGNWHLCHSAVATVLRGGNLLPTTDAITFHDKEDTRSSDDDRWTKKRRTTTTTSTSFQHSETSNTLESATDSASTQTKLLHLFF